MIMQDGARVTRRVLLMGVIGLLSVSGLPCARWAAAEPVGSPAKLLKKGQSLFGLRGGGMQRNMQDAADATEFHGGYVRGYGLTDRFSLFGFIGGGYISAGDATVTNSFGGNLGAGAQLKTLLWESARRAWSWDASVQYLFLGKPQSGEKNQARWNEWQFATSVARSFDRLQPYAGVKVSLVTLDYKLRKDGVTVQQGTYKPKNIAGPFLGLDWCVGEERNTFLTLEGSYLNGAEITFAVAKRF